jgi:hypothetical protein
VRKRERREAQRAERARLERERERLREQVSLIHRDGSSFDADQRIGAKLVLSDGTTLVERVKTPPSRWASYASRSLIPSSARVASPPRPDIPGWS